jgi:sodium/potassium/calcium exchanger 6
LTIPPGEEKDFHWIMGIVYPFSCSIFAIFSTQIDIFFRVSIFGKSMPILLVMLPFQIFLCILMWFNSDNHKPKPALLFTVLSSIMAVLWIYIEANFVMDFLQFVEYVSGWSKVFLSLSLLSLGNSLGDLFVDTALAKKGLGVMAMTGVFSGQLFNLMIGFALNCLYSYFR